MGSIPTTALCFVRSAGRRLLTVSNLFKHRSHSSVGQSVGLINLRSAVRARVGAFIFVLWLNLLILVRHG